MEPECGKNSSSDEKNQNDERKIPALVQASSIWSDFINYWMTYIFTQQILFLRNIKFDDANLTPDQEKVVNPSNLVASKILGWQ